MGAKLRIYFIIVSSRLQILGWIVLWTSYMLIQSACFDESFVEDAALDVTFSVDTLTFDTVFTSVGSATRFFTIANRTDHNVILSSITLAQGFSSMFRINVDGISTYEARDVKILAHDSIYVFAEVTVDPDQPVSVSPFVITEEILVSSGGVTERVVLEAFGQNANYFPSRDAGGQILGLSCANGNIVWDDAKPYVIYGLLFIDSCMLEISPGTRIYVHGGLARLNETIFQDGGLLFLSEGRLRCDGTSDDPIVFQGDRLEAAYADLPGQWAGIRFLSQSRGHSISHTTIKNAIVGIRADSAAQVSLSEVQIYNTSNAGVIGVHANITMDNTLIHSNGSQSVAFTYGGHYLLRHCTLANFQNQQPALYVDNFACLDANCSVVDPFPLAAKFENCIIMGSNKDEIVVNDIAEGEDEGLLRIAFDHSLIKVDESKQSYPATSCINCIEHVDQPVFLDEQQDLYQLDTLSIARGQGTPIEDLPLDLYGHSRDLLMPDIGCIEWLP